jgi:AraC family transcriptional activator of pobA
MALWLPRGMRGEFRLFAGGEGFSLSLAEDFIRRAIGEGFIAPHLRPLLERIVVAAADRLLPHLDELRVSCESLIRESRELQPGAAAICVAHVSLLLLHLWRAADLMGAVAGFRGMASSTVQRFRQLVELHYRDDLRVEGYARQLGVTRAHLHDACLRATGRTPLALVHERLTTEACMRLEQTELPVEQVGYSLGFRDPCYFNRFFKKRTGRTPAAFRQELRRTRASGERICSYAAWP